MSNLEALRKLAGGPKLEAARVVGLFLAWAAQYRPASRWSALEIDGAPRPMFAPVADSEVKATGGVISKCRRCGCQGDASGLCSHCVFDQPCPHAGEVEPSRWDVLEIDNPVDHDAVADAIVMAFFALRSPTRMGIGAPISVLTESNPWLG